MVKGGDKKWPNFREKWTRYGGLLEVAKKSHMGMEEEIPGLWGVAGPVLLGPTFHYTTLLVICQVVK